MAADLRLARRRGIAKNAVALLSAVNEGGESPVGGARIAEVEGSVWVEHASVALLSARHELVVADGQSHVSVAKGVPQRGVEFELRDFGVGVCVGAPVESRVEAAVNGVRVLKDAAAEVLGGSGRRRVVTVAVGNDALLEVGAARVAGRCVVVGKVVDVGHRDQNHAFLTGLQSVVSLTIGAADPLNFAESVLSLASGRWWRRRRGIGIEGCVTFL